MLLIGYCRVAKASQKKPGSPGLEAQRQKVQQLADRIAGREGVVEVIGWFTEIEAHRETRLQLARAVAAAREHGAVVVVAQLYQLARDADFLAQLVALKRSELLRSSQDKTKRFGGFLFADLPHFARSQQAMAELLAELARLEQQAPGRPIREALAATKARGVKLGGTRPGTLRENARTKAAALEQSEQLRPLLAPMEAQGASLREMSAALAAEGTTTKKGNPLSADQIKRHLRRLGLRTC